MRSIHIISEVDGKTNEERKRFGFARLTFRHLLDFGVIPCYIKDEELSRTSKDIGDTRTLPFFKDLINIGINRFNPDIIFFSNADTNFCSNTIEVVSKALEQKEVCYARRWNFKTLEQEITPDKIKEGVLEPYGADLVVFTFKWWNEYKDFYPDCLVACHKWDVLLSDLFEITTPRCEVKDIIYHLEHEYYWRQPSNFLFNKGQKWNKDVSKGVYEKYRILRLLAGMMRGEIDRDYGFGSCNHELKSIYQQESNLLKFFCNPL